MLGGGAAGGKGGFGEGDLLTVGTDGGELGGHGYQVGVLGMLYSLGGDMDADGLLVDGGEFWGGAAYEEKNR